jgi:hypothetical protein
MADQLTLADRHLVLKRLGELADEIGLISSWLTGLDEDRAAILLEDAYRSIATASWALERVARLRPEGWTAPGAQQGPQPAVLGL